MNEYHCPNCKHYVDNSQESVELPRATYHICRYCDLEFWVVKKEAEE